LFFKVNPTDENDVYLGGQNLYRSFTGFEDSTSTVLLGGYPYYDLSNNSLHPDMHAIAFQPKNHIMTSSLLSW